LTQLKILDCYDFNLLENNISGYTVPLFFNKWYTFQLPMVHLGLKL